MHVAGSSSNSNKRPLWQFHGGLHLPDHKSMSIFGKVDERGKEGLNFEIETALSYLHFPSSNFSVIRITRVHYALCLVILPEKLVNDAQVCTNC